MDLHHNLFYAYRGPDTDGADRDRQLENNVTKGLINTLRLGGEAVCKKDHLLYFCIDRPAVPPPKLIELSECDAVQLVVKCFQRNHAVVKLLNG